MNNRLIFLDNASTTPVDPRVINVVIEEMNSNFGNANSIDHDLGTAAGETVVKARRLVANLVGCNPQKVIFNSGSTEGINSVLFGLQSQKNRPLRIGLSKLEHKATLAACEYMESKGLARLYWFRVDGNGGIDLQFIKEVAQKEKLDLLIMMAANNEIGAVYPVNQVAALSREFSASYFCDATQAAGKVSLAFDEWGIDYLVLSSHKIYGPKGVGALVVKNKDSLNPIIHGGGQQNNLRSGTLNVPGIAGFGEACRLRTEEMAVDEFRIRSLRDKLVDHIKNSTFQVVLLGPDDRLAGIVPIAFPGIPNKAVISRIRDKVAISTGAACSSGVEAPSHVLTEMGLPKDVIEGFIRISIGKFNTEEEINQAAKIIKEAVDKVKAAL